MTHQRSHAKLLAALTALLSIAVMSCQNSPMSPPMKQVSSPVLRMGNSSINGAAGQVPAYYDSTLFTINFAMLSPDASGATLNNNKSVNTIYMSDALLAGNKPFVSVLDAIQGDGFNPLWQEVDIIFNAGVAPHQFFSDNEVLAAAGGTNPEITLSPTTEMYRCSVVGSK